MYENSYKTGVIPVNDDNNTKKMKNNKGKSGKNKDTQTLLDHNINNKKSFSFLSLMDMSIAEASYIANANNDMLRAVALTALIQRSCSAVRANRIVIRPKTVRFNNASFADILSTNQSTNNNNNNTDTHTLSGNELSSDMKTYKFNNTKCIQDICEHTYQHSIFTNMDLRHKLNIFTSACIAMQPNIVCNSRSFETKYIEHQNSSICARG